MGNNDLIRKSLLMENILPFLATAKVKLHKDS